MSNSMSMHLITLEEYDAYLREHPEYSQEKENARSYGPPFDYEPESTTVWSFPDRGNWATHNGRYRGNWSPYVPRNLILKYTQENELVLDQMCGSGTTLVECSLLSRKSIGIDININAVMLSKKNLEFCDINKESLSKIYLGDARKLDKIEKNSVDLIATHPPYAGIIAYSKRTIDGDLSALSITKYAEEMRAVAQESFRVLKPGRYCGILIGDTRKHLHYVPISFIVLQVFLESGFLLKEDIIKLQWKTKGTRERWRGKSYDFYKIAHEHLFIFRKPTDDDTKAKYKLSSLNILEHPHQ